MPIKLGCGQSADNCTVLDLPTGSTRNDSVPCSFKSKAKLSCFACLPSRMGKLALTPAGCQQRDELVLGLCHARHLPVAVSMGGGYSERLADIVDAHCNTFRVAFELWP